MAAPMLRKVLLALIDIVLILALLSSLAVLGFTLAAWCERGAALAQEPVRSGPVALAVEGQADSLLTAAWSTKVYQNERAYCGSWTRRGDTLVVFAAVPASVTRDVSWDTIAFACPPGEITIHTHPPQDCNPTGTYCAYTTWREAACAGSVADEIATLGTALHFGVVQCGRNVFGLYFAPTFRPAVRFAGTP